MQKLSVEFKNTPGNASQVPCSVNEILTREDTLSVSSKVLADNNSNENLHSGMSGQNMRVFVLNMRGNPLIPTTPGKARKLLEQNRAKVVQRTPFTIQLLYATGETKQDITFGVDPGYSYIGYSVVSDTTELIAGEVELRNDITKLLDQRASYRRTRRGRLWHREPRFNNRGRDNGWFAPSIQHKLNSHINFIDRIKSILPITKTVVEIASFDQQKIQNPEISGVEYQQGELLGYEIREYLLEKWKRTCAYCGKTDIPLEIEHIIPKSRGGSNRVSNLTIACHACNQAKDNMTAGEFGHPTIQTKAKKPLKSAAFMNIVKKKLANILDCEVTYGYITKHDRFKLGLTKSHVNDAFVIASGNTQHRCETDTVTLTRRNNRSIQTNRKGFKPSIRRHRYNLQPNDLVEHDGLLYWVKGVFNYGKWVRLVDSAGIIINSNIKKVELLKYGKGLQFT
ncbi:MAG: hypothetical protein EF812_04375 [Methanosarcinales archaeon]|nr:MAG: hypothetical protein EF812_04375 [Methanosarcinales archaeon]